MTDKLAEGSVPSRTITPFQLMVARALLAFTAAACVGFLSGRIRHVLASACGVSALNMLVSLQVVGPGALDGAPPFRPGAVCGKSLIAGSP